MVKNYTCSHCGHANVISGEEWELGYNCPVLACPNCQNPVLIPECKEIAISKISFDDKLPISLWALGILLFGVILLLCSFDFGTTIVIFRPKNLLLGLLAIAIGFAMAVSGIKNFKRKRTYFAEEKARSEARCADPDYVEMLLSLGYQKK